MIKNEFEKVCCFTGYRPNKFPFPLKEGNPFFTELENRLIETVFSLTDDECHTFISGMAMGFDIIAAEAVLLLKSRNPRVRLICAVPYPEQAEGFSADWRKRYDNIISKADEVVTVSDKYSNTCFFVRNKYMVDKSDCVVTWFDGKSGGTAATLRYAAKLCRHIINLNPLAKEYNTEQLYFNI